MNYANVGYDSLLRNMKSAAWP